MFGPSLPDRDDDARSFRPVHAEPVVLRLADAVFRGGLSCGEYITTRDPRDRSTHTITQLVLHSKQAHDRDREIARRIVKAHRAAALPAVDVVVAPPPRPDTEDRFVEVRAAVARQLRAVDGRAVVRNVADIPRYRQLPRNLRSAATAALRNGRFEVNDPRVVRGRAVLIIDDVTNSGEQARSLRDALLSAGARDVQLISLASTGPS